MTRVIRVLTLLVTVALIYGCGSTAKLTGVRPDQVNDKTWVLVSMNGKLMTDSRVWLQFKPSTPQQGRASGRAQCNGYFGGYRVEDGRLRFTPMGSTRMACPGPLMKEESQYLQAFSSLDGLSINDDKLLLTSSMEKTTLRYAAESASVTGQVVPVSGHFVAGSEVIIRLHDSSMPGDPAGVVGVERIRLGSDANSAVDYQVRYTPYRVNPKRSYQLSVQVVLHGQVLYNSVENPVVELKSAPVMNHTD